LYRHSSWLHPHIVSQRLIVAVPHHLTPFPLESNHRVRLFPMPLDGSIPIYFKGRLVPLIPPAAATATLLGLILLK
jgi:hypothetical protein